MRKFPVPLDLQRIKVQPLAQRRSLSSLEKILAEADKSSADILDRDGQTGAYAAHSADSIRAARKRNASVILMYGAHLVKNGAHRIVIELMERGWITHLATNGAGSIHDWELAFLGRTEESVRDNVATGTFGTWDETGRYLQLALLAGALREEGYGRSLGRFVTEDGVTVPEPAVLEKQLCEEPAHPLSAARADLLQTMRAHKISGGRIEVKHPQKETCILAQAFRQNIPFTVHPGIGYDIVANHPMFNGAVIGRTAQTDFALLGSSIEQLDGGVVLSVGSAIMAPQVFEKSVSCVNNLRLQDGRKILHDHTIYVVDIQDGGNWDWSRGEPPKDNPAYYLRFCKSFSRMGGAMHYAQCDNVEFLQSLLAHLKHAPAC
jgi:hypothetical protein